MEHLGTILAGIDYKLRRLLADQAALKERLRKLTEENEELHDQLTKTKEEKENIYKQLDIIKLRNTLAAKSDSTEIKLKINQLIRKIDRSIEFLNKVN